MPLYTLVLFILLVSYLIGSIPTAYLAGKILKGIDIREVGSGNIGATNVFRAVGKTAGVGVLVIDILKGVIPVLLAARMSPEPYVNFLQIGAGIAAICGHNWTFWLNFKGGKGVATTTGVLLTLAPLATLSAFIFFALTVWLTRYISLGSIVAASVIPFLILVFNRGNLALFGVGLVSAILIDIKHLPNIKRLRNHEEHKFSFRKDKT